MKFPGYVPIAVQNYIKQRVEGSQPPVDGPTSPHLRSVWLRSLQGLASVIATTRRGLAELDPQIAAASRSNQREQLAELEEYRETLRLHLKQLEEERDTLNRLAADERMRSAYSHLTGAFVDEGQWAAFFNAALAARADFALARATLNRATILKGKIANTAEQLALLLSEFGELDILGPAEFTNPPGLLHRDSIEVVQHLENRGLAVLAENGLEIKWPPPEEEACGDQQLDTQSGQSSNEGATSVTEANQAPSNFLDILFESSQYMQLAEYQRPSTVDIIDGIAIAARNYTPELHGASAAAIQSRKNNRKTQYIRAFWHLIVNDPRVFRQTQRTPKLMHAMAITATVVLNDQDDDVSYDDVRKALEDRSNPTRKNVPRQRSIRHPKKR